MLGYYNDEETTRSHVRDGWFHTGDIGHQDEEGYVHITDRLKEVLISAGGKNVSPQPIELQLKSTKWISEAVVLGDRMPYFVCLLVPDFIQLEAEAKKYGWGPVPRSDLLERPEVLRLYETTLAQVNESLASFEQLKRFALLERDLSQETDELTPTLKVKRRVVVERYAAVIEELYQGHLPPSI